DAVVSDAYERIMPEYTLRRFKRLFREQVLDADVMHETFNFQQWREHLLLPDERESRISTYRPALTFWSMVHVCLLSTLLHSRGEQLQDQLEADRNFFTIKNRQENLEESISELRTKVGRRCFPGANQDSDGAYRDERIQGLLDSIGSIGASVDEETLEFLSHVYLLALNDGPGLFRQYTHHDHDEPLLFQLMEIGYIIETRKLDRDPDTGNFIMTLDHLASYLDDLALFITASDAWADRKT
ncbi:MAG: hypothetical protein SVU32_01255, partial [Candidatus Nanohaloarchaea archaeon]|nr:hypothetical protein [Candidatus Nanohaloarchaea archaeon]